MPDNPNDGPIPPGSQSPTEWTRPPAPPVKEPSTLATIFVGPNGIRAGWRLLMLIAFMAVTAVAVQVILTHIPFVVRHIPPKTSGPTVMTPTFAIFGEALM